MERCKCHQTVRRYANANTVYDIAVILSMFVPLEVNLFTSFSYFYNSWWRDIVASVVRRMNEVALRRTRLVLGWVTVFGRIYHHGM